MKPAPLAKAAPAMMREGQAKDRTRDAAGLDTDRWDWVTVLVLLLVAALFVVLTIDFWLAF